MTSGSLLYPRLDQTTARRILASQAGVDLGQLRALGALEHPDAAPAATGGHPAPINKLQDVQDVVRGIAEQTGFPKPLAGATQDFDRPCGSALFKTMEIVPADAAEEGVWSFITLVLVPEIGPWRFPGQPDERMMGRPRNVLRRLWWRAWALGPDLHVAPDGCTPLGEDESVQIMERPSLGGNRRTATALQEALWRAERAGLSVPRSPLMRELTRRLRATRSRISLDALDDSQFEALLDRLTTEAVRDLRG
jgi:hypothetical protein